jgi:para-nitrobenzyl esterase
MHRWILGAALLFLAVFPARPQTVRVDGGEISGTTGFNPDIRVYKGVPFAAPPVGNLRWRDPQPVPAWQGIKQTTEFSPMCMQRDRPLDSYHTPGVLPVSEDCLYLNVWTPAKSAAERLPVMVYIHGGGFAVSSGIEKWFNGERLAEKGVVLVTINYRLGVFGFLAHPELTKESEHHASGSYGMLDQIYALKWVQRNIGAFGGDPKRVTIFGQSAGSESVCMDMATPLAKGLYIHAIAESVGCFGPFTPEPKLAAAEQEGVQFLSDAKVNSIAELRAMPAQQLQTLKTQVRFRPIIDGYFLPTDPYTIYSKDQENIVPVILGSNSDEGLLMGPAPESLAAYIQQTKKMYGDKTEQFLKIYPASNDAEAREDAYTIGRDQIAWQARIWADLVSRGKAKTYRYYFSRVPPVPDGMFREQKVHPLGAFHQAEIVYVFGALDTRNFIWTDLDRKISGEMMAYWTNFAKTGDPNGPNLPKWTPSDPENDVVMGFGDTIAMRPGVSKAALDFWDSFYSKGSPAD